MFGWFSSGQRLGLARESVRKSRIVANRRGKDLDRDEPIQFPLPCFVDDPHASLAEVFKNLKLGKLPGECFQIGDGEPRRRWPGGSRPVVRCEGRACAGVLVPGCLTANAGLHQTLRANPSRCVG